MDLFTFDFMEFIWLFKDQQESGQRTYVISASNASLPRIDGFVTYTNG